MRFRFEVAMTAEVNDQARGHLLQHYKRDRDQEDLCFALWRPSNGRNRCTGLIYRILLPQGEERNLHGNTSFEPAYLARVVALAREEKAGLACMHSHPASGWQGMSAPDIEAERDVVAYPAGATGLPLIGLTVGSDGYWSARFWEKSKGGMTRHPCEKVRVIGTRTSRFYFDDLLVPPPARREALKRTIDSWGEEAQRDIARLRVGIVGLGSVGGIVAEAMARIGIADLTLIDPDHVEPHNLDRLIYASERDIGKRKVDLAERAVRSHATAEGIKVTALPFSIRERTAYQAAIDCDILFSCVDRRPIARDALNYIAYAHMIPVIDGGVSIEPLNDRLHSAHWRAHLVGPGLQCMRCIGQYDSSGVSMELDGSLDNQSYIENLPPEEQPNNRNVFPFALSVAAMEVNLMLRHLLAQDWWPVVQQQDYQFVRGDVSISKGTCYASCEFPRRVAMGDHIAPFYLLDVPRPNGLSLISALRSCFSRMRRLVRSTTTDGGSAR